LRALSTCKEHAKKIKNTKHLGRGSKTPNAHGKHTKKIKSIRHSLRACTKDGQHLAHTKCM